MLLLALVSGGGTQLTMVLLEPLMGRLFSADSAAAAESGAGSPMASFNDS